MVEVGDGAIAYRGVDCIRGLGSSHGLEVGLVFGGIPCSPLQCRHGSSGTGAVGEYAVGVAGDAVVVVVEIAGGGFQVEQPIWSSPGIEGLSVGGDGRAVAAGAGDAEHIALGEGTACRIGHRRCRGRRGHVATHIVAHEDGYVAVVAPAEVERHVDVEGLVSRILNIPDIEDTLVGLEPDDVAHWHGDGVNPEILRVETEGVMPRGEARQGAYSQCGRDEMSFHNREFSTSLGS